MASRDHAQSTGAATGAHSPAAPCPRCLQRYGGKRPAGYGSDPRCAFPGGGPFTEENWQCATAGLIRDFVGNYPGDVERRGVSVMEEMDQKVAAVMLADEMGEGLFDRYESYPRALIVTWYKSRGRTENIAVICDQGDSQRPTARDIEDICGAEHVSYPPSARDTTDRSAKPREDA